MKKYCTKCGGKMKEISFHKLYDRKTGKEIFQYIIYCLREGSEPLRHDVLFKNVENRIYLDKEMKDFLINLRGGEWVISDLTGLPHKKRPGFFGNLLDVCQGVFIFGSGGSNIGD